MASASASSSSASMSDREAAVYDRAIRLWGAEAQKRLMTAKVLVCGMDGLAAELCKNLALSGISLTLHDDTLVSSKDLSANFFLSKSSVGTPRATACLKGIQELNPLVTISLHTGSLPGVSDTEFWSQFVIVCTNGLSNTSNTKFAAMCRRNGCVFFAGMSHGLVGGFASDFGDDHRFKTVVATSGGVGSVSVEAADSPVASINSPTLADLLGSPMTSVVAMLTRRRQRDPKAVTVEAAPAWAACQAVEEASEHLGESASPESVTSRAEASLQALAKETPAVASLLDAGLVATVVRCRHMCVTPVCAVVGGQWGQEVIRTITGRSPPLGNTFILDARKHPSGQFGWLPAEPIAGVAGASSSSSSSSSSSAAATMSEMTHAADMGDAIELSDDDE